MGALFERTKRREQYLKDKGYEIVFVWEMDFDQGALSSTHPLPTLTPLRAFARTRPT
jgi:G:T-mismatch repair DNA endonuclease (very short patch repair protein)